MWKVLERNGFCTKPHFYDIITEVPRKNPCRHPRETAYPSPYLLTDAEYKIVR